MAKYGINPEGVASLNQLARDMSTLNDDIEANGKTLKNVVVGLEEDLGIYGEEIIDLIGNINAAQEKGRASVEQLTASVKKLANDVQDLVNAGLG